MKPFSVTSTLVDVFLQSFDNLKFLFKLSPSSLISQRESERKVARGSPNVTLCSDVARPFRNTVNHFFWWLQPTENLQYHLGALPKGMSIHRGNCVWMVVSEAGLPTETIKSTVTASGQNKEPFFSHNSATFRLSKSQKTRGADKDNSMGRWRWRENECRQSWFSFPQEPEAYLSQRIKSNSATRCGLGHLYWLTDFLSSPQHMPKLMPIAI